MKVKEIKVENFVYKRKLRKAQRDSYSMNSASPLRKLRRQIHIQEDTIEGPNGPRESEELGWIVDGYGQKSHKNSDKNIFPGMHDFGPPS